MKRLILGTVLILVLAYGIASGDTHYVSPYGNDTPPYDSWDTAADSIQEGINAASYGDTVRVGAGTYFEYRITLGSGVALIGAGLDSCIIDASWVHQDTIAHIVDGADSSSVEGFHIIGNKHPPYADYLTGIGDPYGIPMKVIRGNEFTKCLTAIFLRKCPEITNNLIDDCSGGISVGTWATALIQNNTITHCSMGISGSFSPRYPKIVKNVIHTVLAAISITLNDSLMMCNNLIYENMGLASVAVGDSISTDDQLICNNTIAGNKPSQYGVLNCSGDSDVRNNIVFGGDFGILAYRSGILLTVSYNDLWDNTQNYKAQNGAVIDTSLGGNIYLDPMFVGGDDYHLQYGSPCIDAGDPNIKDPDSSRSDIGCYGGTWGETYTYQDYPPKAPDSLKATSLNTVIVLSWKPNTESDLSHYLVYRDTIQAFIPDTLKIVGNIPKDSSVFWDHDFVMGKTYYYQVSAWDLTAHQSEYSDELEVEATSVGEYTEEENRPPMYQLFQNYPNPFNSSTVIWYFLPDVGYQPAEVEITVYNILGKVVRKLVNKRQFPGNHRILWDGKDDSGNEAASGIYFCKLKVSGLDLVKAKKMVLLR